MKSNTIAKTLFGIAILTGALSAQEPEVAREKDKSSPADVTQNPVDPTIIKELVGEWENDMQPPSTFTIKSIDPATGKLEGTYKSGSGAGAQAFPTIGWVNTAPPETDKPDHVIVISFSTRWGQIGSVTAWNGFYRLEGTEAKIVGQWNLSRPNAKFQWEHIVAGQDRYKKVKKAGN